MKKLFILAAVVFAILSFQSCGTYYEYIQLLSTKPVNENAPITQTNGGILYEDDDCAIFYKFWNEGGNPGFEFYNKTDKIIYIDLSKTFFIKNGVAYDYFTQQTITKTKTTSTSASTTATQSYGLSATRSYSASISQYYAGNFGYMPITTLNPLASSATTSTSKSARAIAVASVSKGITTTIGHSTSVATTNNPILSIPPKSSKVICNFSITAHEIIDCNLKYYPEQSSKIEYTIENSPIVFANYITFKVGENSQYTSVENEFYVNEISNYAKQEVIDYVKREKACENVLTPEQIKSQKYQPDIYDLYITVGNESTFYTTYKIFSKSKLYKKKLDYFYWDYNQKGYINKTPNTTE